MSSIDLRQLGCLWDPTSFVMDQTATAWGLTERKRGWMQHWKLVCGVPDVSSNVVVITHHSVSKKKWEFPPFLFFCLFMISTERQRTWFTLQLCHNNFRVKFRCQARSITIHYQLSPDDWRFNFAAQRSSVQRKVAANEAVIIISASCLKIIGPRLGKKTWNKPVVFWVIYVKLRLRREERKLHPVSFRESGASFPGSRRTASGQDGGLGLVYLTCPKMREFWWPVQDDTTLPPSQWMATGNISLA